MTMKRLSTGEISELSGIPVNTLNDWVNAGFIRPVEGGEGKGRHRRWSIAQAVVLCFAAEWRDRGAGRPILKSLIANLTRVSDRQLLAKFKAGERYLVELPDGKIIKPIGRFIDLERYDLERVYKEVIRKVSEMEKRDRNATGRNRALASLN